MEELSFIHSYLLITLGIFISMVIPIIMKIIGSDERSLSVIWKIIKPYLLIAILSFLVGIIIYALVGNTISDWKAAILAGYAWDSTLQKVGTNLNENNLSIYKQKING